MESPKLNGARAKLRRAADHIRDIDAALAALLVVEADPKSPSFLDQKFDGKHHIITIPKAKPIDPSLPLLIGDALHNMRSALDHLVYQLALQNGSPSSSAAKTFFPIYLDEPTFDKRVKKLVKPFISGPALTEIKEIQPYKAYDVPNEADIWILSQLDIIDKHRLLIVARHRFAVDEFTVTVPTGEQFHTVVRKPQWKAMEDGAEVIRFNLSRAIRAPGKVNVKIKMASTVQLVETGLACDGAIVQDALRQCVGMAAAIVSVFGAKFFGE